MTKKQRARLQKELRALCLYYGIVTLRPDPWGLSAYDKDGKGLFHIDLKEMQGRGR